MISVGTNPLGRPVTALAPRDGHLAERLGFAPPCWRPAYESMALGAGIGLIGVHWVALCMHLPAYEAAGLQVFAACDREDARFDEAAASGYDLGRRHRDWRDVIVDETVEVVDCTFGHHPARIAQRLEVVEACARAGKPVLIHKPAACRLDLALEMSQCAREAGIVLAVNQNARYNPATWSVRQLLAPQRLGPPRLMEVRSSWTGHPPAAGDARAATIGHCIHHADLLRWWAGSDCVGVTARAGSNATLAIYEFANGCLAYHSEDHSGVREHRCDIRVVAARGTIHAAHNWNWHLAGAGEHDRVAVTPGKHEAAVELPLPRFVSRPAWWHASPWRPGGERCYDLGAPVAGMLGSMAQLQHAAATGCRPDNDFDGGIASLRMCLAAQISAREGGRVMPDEVPADAVMEVEG